MSGISAAKSGPVSHLDVDKEGSVGDKNPLSGAMDGAKGKAKEYAIKMFNAMESSRWKALLIGIALLGFAALFMFVILPHIGFDFSNPSLGSAMMPMIGGAAAGLGLYGIYCALTGKKLRERISQQQSAGDLVKGLLGLGLVGFGAWAIVSSGIGHGWGGNGWFYIGFATSLAATVVVMRSVLRQQTIETYRAVEDLEKQRRGIDQQNSVEMHSLRRGGEAHRAQTQTAST